MLQPINDNENIFIGTSQSRTGYRSEGFKSSTTVHVRCWRRCW